MSLPFTLANGPGNTPDATQLMANFNALLKGLLQIDNGTPTQIASNMSVAGKAFLSNAGATALTIQGFSGGVAGQTIWVFNDSTTNSVTFVHAGSGTQTFSLEGSASLSLGPLGGASFVFNNTVGVWVCTGVQAGAPASGQANMMDNGGFEIWQRGTTFSAPATSAYLCDRWRVSTNEATNVTVTKETTTVDSIGLASMKVVITSTSASKNWHLQNNIEDFSDYRGKALTITARVKCSVANAVTVRLSDGINATYSPYHSGGGGWETLSVTMTIGATAGELLVALGMIQNGEKANGTFYFDNVMLVQGTSGLTFVPTNPQVDFARCQRYFQVLGIGGGWIYPGVCLNSTLAWISLKLNTTMRAAPSITVNSPTLFQTINNGGTGSNLTALTSGDALPDGIRLAATVASGFTTGFSTLMQGNGGSIYASADL